jgi:tetratricopeptide (TPR) repeat protein
LNLPTVLSASGAAEIARSGLALVVALAADFVVGLLRVPQLVDSQRARWIQPAGIRSWIWLAIAAILATLVPAAFTRARQDLYEKRLGELIAQGRLGQAARLSVQLAELAPSGKLNGQPLRAVAQGLQLRVHELEQQAAIPLADRTPAALLERARMWAILGNVEQAERTLEPLLQPPAPHPAACLLLGTAYESQEDWLISRHWYEAAQAALRHSSSQPHVTRLFVQATKGVAYTERKLGRYREAEAAYLEVLALAPTAEMHFLLAQFYDDGQQAAKAHEHAQAAARIDPATYLEPARRLTTSLAQRQFGCLWVYWRRD